MANKRKSVRSRLDLYDNHNRTGLGASDISNPPIVDGDKPPKSTKMSRDEQQQLCFEVIKQYERGVGAEAENRRLFSEDLRFVYQDTIESDGQWDSAVLIQRRGRPSYTFNRVIGTVNMVLGDQRQTRPQAKVRAANAEASQETALIFDGLIRDIELCSGAESIYDCQFKNGVAGGWGAWRIVPEYENDRSFNQVLRIKDIPNPLTVVWDPESTNPCKDDSMWAIVAERISREKYKALYPDHDPVSLQFSRDSRGWATENEIRVAEYFKKVPVYKEIAEYADGRVVDWDDAHKAADKHLSGMHPQGDYNRVVRTRKIKTWAVEWYLIDQANVLAGPIRYNWKRIPVIRLPGRCINIEGKQKVQSLVRHTKDPQRTYNFHRSTMVESLAAIPKSPYMVTPKMIKGYEDIWATANNNVRPYLPFDPDPDLPGEKPTREPPPDVPEALLAVAQADLNDIQAATGYFDASLGDDADSDRTSGKALIARQRRSDLGSYEFIDNFGKALKISHECMIDMIPTVYDTQRIVRVIGPDGVEKYEKVNHIQGSQLINSLKEGAYDVTVTIGPSYQTARQEMLATLIEAADVMPQIAQVAPDLIVKNIDSPDVDELVRRLRVPLVQQGLVKPTPDEQKQMPPPQPPDPMTQANVALLQAKAQAESGKAAVSQSKAQAGPLEQAKIKADIQHQQADAALNFHKARTEGQKGQQELQINAQQNQMDLQKMAAEHQMEMTHMQQEHQLKMHQQQEQHKVDMMQAVVEAHQNMQTNAIQNQQMIQQGAEGHHQEIKHGEESHKQKIEHGAESHKEKLRQAKATRAMTPKKGSAK